MKKIAFFGVCVAAGYVAGYALTSLVIAALRATGVIA